MEHGVGLKSDLMTQKPTQYFHHQVKDMFIVTVLLLCKKRQSYLLSQLWRRLFLISRLSICDTSDT